MATVKIINFIFVDSRTNSTLDPLGAPFVPVGSFENNQNDIAMVIGNSLASTDPTCTGIIIGINWLDKTDIQTVVLYVNQP